jgi:hypothetical protein
VGAECERKGRLMVEWNQRLVRGSCSPSDDDDDDDDDEVVQTIVTKKARSV